MGSILAGLLSPIGLLSAAILALGAYLIYSSGLGGQALSWLADRFGDLREFVSKSIGGIGDALARGDIALAAQVLWLALKLTWQNGIGELERLWAALSGFLVKTAVGAFYGSLAAAEQMWHGLKVAWIEGVAFLRQVWTQFSAWHASMIESAADAMVKAWIWAKKQMDASFDADFASQYAGKQHQAQQKQIETQRQASLGQLQQDRSSQQQAESQRHEERLADVGQQYQALAEAMDAQSLEKMKATEAALAQARAEWQAAIEEARQKWQAESDQPAGPSRPQSIADYLETLDGAILGAQKSIAVSGTFNAMEARGLGAGPVADRIARSSEETARNTRRLLDEVREGGMEFE
jgi:hypothetical protein